jgi:hypothetical protein
LKTKKQSRPPAPIKAAFTANFAFDAAAGDLRPAEAVLAWLNGRAVRRVSPEDIQRHLAGLRDRVGGGNRPQARRGQFCRLAPLHRSAHLGA